MMPSRHRRGIRRGRRVVLAIAITIAGACARPDPRQAQTGGRADIGRVAMERRGCGACHEIAGVLNARGRAGPALTHFGRQAMIAGYVPNTAANLLRWIRDPQAVSPGTAMPDLGISAEGPYKPEHYRY